MMIAGLFFTIFAILGVQLFKGELHRCTDANGDILYGVSQVQCENGLGFWGPGRVSFDNFALAFLVLFEVASLEMWPYLMHDVVDSVGEGFGPVYMNRPEAAAFFVAFIVVGSFFTMGLFVGVLVDQYNKQHEKFTGSHLLDEQQRDFLQAYKDMIYHHPPTVSRRMIYCLMPVGCVRFYVPCCLRHISPY